ncbi:MAG: TonB-dependent receptor [Lysobacteraceae bacterium]
MTSALPPCCAERPTTASTAFAFAIACLIGVSLLAPALAKDESDADAEARDESLPRVVVSAIPVAGDPARTPASISHVAVDASRHAGPLDGLSDVLAGVPGLSVRNRHNHAQDEQISIRGYGARATFGVRGLRLYTDGIPAAMPDGAGQVSHFSLDGAERIEVLRGPFSALYGNSSGGVIALHSARGVAPGRWNAALRAGSDAFRRLSLDGRGAIGQVGYNLALSRFDGDGFRDHSAARRDTFNLRLDHDWGETRQLTLIANAVDMPDIQDPLGLTWEQAQADPRQAVANATLFNTRKSVRQHQAGAILRQDLGAEQGLRLLGYAGKRRVEQFLAIPQAAQNNPLHSGGVIDLDTGYHGVDLRWQFEGEVAGRPLALAAGLSGDRQDQRRRGFENHVDGVPGLRGALRRDERNRVSGFDQYLQADWRFAPRWSLLAGLRHSALRFSSRDAYVGPGNPDDSGRVRHADSTPVAGLMWHASQALRLYASHGHGFETPTFAELSYRADGGAGLAFDLRPARSRNSELGAKWRPSRGVQIEAALFHADTDDELAVARNSGGRSSFRNVARARRAGVELAADWTLTEHWGLRAAWTRIAAHFRDGFLACAGTPCLTPVTPVATGSPIPGVPRSQLFARLDWDDGPWQAALDLSRSGVTVVNDLATQTAPAHALVGIEGARQFGPLRLSLRIDNLFDRAYIGAVIVNDGNGRYYEPGPGRQWHLGAQWTL